MSLPQPRRTLAATLLTLLWATPALAVPVGTTPDTRPAAPQERKQWRDQGIDLQLGGSFLQGNVSLFNLNTALSYNLNLGKHQIFLDTANVLNRFGDTIAVNRVNGSALYAYGLLDNLNLYAYTTHTYDSSIKLDYRLTNGGGVCLHRIGAPWFKLFLVSAGLASENAWFQQNVSQFLVRGVLRTNAILPVTDALDCGLDVFVTPAVTDPADLRVYGEVFARFKITEDLLSVKLSAADEYISRPQPGVKNNDFGVFTTLNLDWGR